MKTTPKLQQINIADITTRDQVRTIFDEDSHDELTNSIKEKGVLQPIGVRKVKDKIVLIYGERRYRAAKAVLTAHKDRTTIPAVVFEEMTDEEALELQIIENLQRKDVHPVEEAIAFKNLLGVKGFDILEISKRVAKGVAYVGSRLKLNDLVPEFQKAFYKDRMNLTTALKLCKIAAADQKELWKERFSQNENNIDVNTWTLNKYMNDLVKAPFDTKDPLLNKKIGACSTCPFNTASNTLLFPDESGRSICTNSSCYREKCDTSYKIKLKEAVDSPEMILVRGSYGHLEKDAQALISKGHKVYLSNGYTSVNMPDAVERSEFEEDLENENYDSKKEMEAAYADALKDYKEDMKKYEADIASGKYVKAFVVEGNDKGQTIFVKINKNTSGSSSSGKSTAKGVQEKLKEGKATAADIRNEIDRMNTAEVRKRELDEEKIWPKVYEFVDEHKPFLTNTKDLSIAEKVALIIILENKLFHNDIDEIFEKAGYKEGKNDVPLFTWLINNHKKLDGFINQFSRFLILDGVSSSMGNAAKRERDAAIQCVAKEYGANHIKVIRDTQMAEREKRAERLKAAIDKLNAQLKPAKVKGDKLSPNVVAAFKTKGKGLSALLPDAKKKSKK